MKLSPQKINKMIPDGKNYQDITESSLYLRNRPLKVWYCVRKKAGKVKWIKLGNYPDMGLSDARRAALKEKNNIQENQLNKHNSAYTLDDIFKEYDKNLEGVRKSIPKYRKMIASLSMIPIAQKHLSDITPDDIRELKRKCEHTPVMFNRYRALISTLFSYACRNMNVSFANPVIHVTKYPETPRKTKLPIEKAKRFFELLDSDKYPEDFRDLLKMLIYGGQRETNTFSMRWEDIDLSNDVWTIPADRSKNGKPMSTPLTPEMKEILLRRRKAAKHPVWVFPRQKRPVTGLTKAGYTRKEQAGHIVNIRRTYRRFLEELEAPELTIHDLRRTHGTWMLNAGASIEQVSASLHHSSIAITQKVYAEMLTKQVRSGVDLMRQAIANAKQEQIK